MDSPLLWSTHTSKQTYPASIININARAVQPEGALGQTRKTRRTRAGAEKKYAWEHGTRCLRLPAYGGSWDSHTMPRSAIQEHISHADCCGLILYILWWSIKHQHCLHAARTASASNFSLVFIAPRHKKMHEDKCARAHFAPIAVFKQMPFSRGKRLFDVAAPTRKVAELRDGWIMSHGEMNPLSAVCRKRVSIEICCECAEHLGHGVSQRGIFSFA